MVNSIRPEAVGCKLTNIYDINSKVYILKLARKGFKCFLLLESGLRFHLTDYQRDKSSIPSNYTMKLRKHIRTKRLTGINQLGADRSVDFTFGYGETAFHLILELYVSGNLLLTDHEYKILALLRTHSDQQSKVAMRQTYPLSSALGLLTVPLVPLEEFNGAIEAILDVAAARQENQEVKEMDEDDAKFKEQSKKSESTFARRSKKRVQHSAMPLVQILHKLAPFADPGLCASCIKKVMEASGHTCPNGFKVTVDDISFDEVLEIMKSATEQALEALRQVSRPDDLGGGSMPELCVPKEGEDQDDFGDEDDDDVAEGSKQDVATPSPPASHDWPAIPGWILRKHVHIPPVEPRWANDDFTPLPPEPGREPEAVVTFPTFHQCVDDFFTKLEEHRAVEQKAQHAQNVYAKVERIRADQGRRIQQLEAEQETSERQAALIEANVELVDRSLQMLNAMLASQVDWGELWREVKRQQRQGHPIAQHIHSLDFENNEFTLLLGAQPDDDDLAEEDAPMEVVPLDLNLTPHANVARLHSRRKETREKTSRTVSHAEAAIKQAERKAHQDLQKFQQKQTIRKVRQNWWFEKFIWFISSENYLVLCGHDALQTEQIFCRHLSQNDVFVQADVAGARSCFVRNTGEGEVPPATLREAGTLALCHSSAWDKHMVISAWWVPVKQVTRGATPTEGDFTIIDNFFVRGRRHFMPPLHPEMGFTLLFHVADSCLERHKGERRSRYLEAINQTTKSSLATGEDDQKEELDSIEGPDETEEKDNHEGDGENEHELAKQDDDKDRGDASEKDSEADEPEDAFNEANAESKEEAAARSGGRARVSRAARKKQKRGDMAADDGEDETFHETEQGKDPDNGNTQLPSGGQAQGAAAAAKLKSAPAGPVALPRGQRAKMKKIKKYADQDEEDRDLRMALLGSKATKRALDPNAAKDSTSAGNMQSKSEVPDAPQEPSQENICEKEAKQPVPSGSKTAKNGDRGVDRRQDKRQPTEVLTAGCDAEGGNAELQLMQFDLLTGQPSPEDEVLYVMPMIAPYCALGGPYSHRVKLTPGTNKKSQTAKQCLKFCEIDKPAWKQFIQSIPDNEVSVQLCGSCKMSMPGMQKLQQQVRKEKKKEIKDQQKMSSK